MLLLHFVAILLDALHGHVLVILSHWGGKRRHLRLDVGREHHLRGWGGGVEATRPTGQGGRFPAPAALLDALPQLGGALAGLLGFLWSV